MNKKIITVGLLSAALISSVLFTGQVKAMWPFDMFVKKGQVKADTTSATNTGSRSGDVLKMDKIYNSINIMNSLCKELAEIKVTEGTKLSTTTPPTTTETVTGLEPEIKPSKFDQPKSALSASQLKELNSIFSGMASRCSNIKALNERLTKLYKLTGVVPGNTMTGSGTKVVVTLSPRPSGKIQLLKNKIKPTITIETPDVYNQ